MPRKKIIEFPEDEKEEKKGKDYEEVWDIKKIAIGVIVLVLLIVGGLVLKRIIFHESLSPSSFIPKVSFPSVKGISTNPNDQTQITHLRISLPSQQDVQNQIQNIQQQVTHLNVAEIASSSPEVQAVLKQIENIPNQGTNQAKDACIRLCNNL